MTSRLSRTAVVVAFTGVVLGGVVAPGHAVTVSSVSSAVQPPTLSFAQQFRSTENCHDYLGQRICRKPGGRRW